MTNMPAQTKNPVFTQSDVEKYRRNRTSVQWTCGASTKTATNSSDELCGGSDRRLRAPLSLDRRRVKSSATSGSDDVRQYGVNYLVGSVLTTVVLTLALVVAVAAVWMRHGGRSTTAGVLNHTHPVVDDAGGRTASATTPGCDAVAYLTSKPS